MGSRLVGLVAALSCVVLGACSRGAEPAYEGNGEVELLEAGAEPRRLLRLQVHPGGRQAVTVEFESKFITKLAPEEDETQIEKGRLRIEATVDGSEDSWSVVMEQTLLDGEGEPESVITKCAVGPRGLESAGAAPAEDGGLGTGIGALVLSVRLPSEPVGIGARWRVGRSARWKSVTLRELLEFRLMETTGELLAIEVTSTMGLQHPDGAGAPAGPVEFVSYEGTCTGRVIVDPALPLVRAADLRSFATIVTRIHMGDASEKLVSGIDVTTVLTTVE